MQVVPRYEAGGRSHQKQRTRTALVAAARELVARGVTPTVEEAAAAAQISRTTAYRYFPTQAALLAEAHPETSLKSLLPARAPTDPAKRLQIVMRGLLKIVVETEDQQRTMLRLSLEGRSDLPLRQGRAIKWIEEALSPLRERFGAARIHRLALAIRSATGIESFVWLVDVGGLSREQAAKSMAWSASAMLDAALAER